MAVRHGHGKVATDGLVFAYDTGDTRNSYKGEPVQNLWDDMLNTQSLRTHTKHYWDGRKWIENGTYSHPGVDGPKGTYLGLVFKHTSGALNNSWSGNSYGYMLRDIACTNGATMTMSSWIYASTDCDVTAIPAVIEQEAGGESTVSGYVSSYDLNNKGTWQVVAKKATSDGQVRFIPLYPRKDGVTDGSFAGFFMWALPQVTYGDHVVQPIQPGETRSSTQGLLDLTGNSSVDLANVSFDSTADIDFDGTDDAIQVPDSNLLDITTDVSFEFVVKAESTQSNPYPRLLDKSVYLVHLSQTAPFSIAQNINTTSGLRQVSVGSAFPADTWTHVITTYDGQFGKIYVNGVLVNSNDFGSELSCNTNGTALKIGGDGGTNRPLNGKIATTKIYNRALSATEVAQNFGHYKTRFGI